MHVKVHAWLGTHTTWQTWFQLDFLYVDVQTCAALIICHQNTEGELKAWNSWSSQTVTN